MVKEMYLQLLYGTMGDRNSIINNNDDDDVDVLIYNKCSV